MLSKRIQTLPKRDTWFYEVHRPGHRALVVKEAANVKLYSPSGNALDCPEVMSAVRKLDARCAVLDCQLIALDVKASAALSRWARNVTTTRSISAPSTCCT